MAEEITEVEELNKLGENLMSAGKLDAAIEYFDKAEAANPNYWQTYRNKGLAYAGKNDYDTAIENMKLVLKVKKDEPVTMFHLANLHFYRRSLRMELYMLIKRQIMALINRNCFMD